MIFEMKSESRFQKLLRQVPVFLPVSPLMIFWYFLVLIIILLDFAFTVVFICFNSAEAQYALWHAIVPLTTIIMGLDILITFNTSFIQNGQIILDRKQIAKNYIFSVYFIFDVLAFVIAFIQIVLRNVFQDQVSGLNFLIYIKIIKAIEFDHLIKKYVLKSASLILYYQMVKNLLLLALLCHTIGSFFFYIDILMIQSDWYSPEYRWIQSSYCYENIIDLPVGWQYAYGFYYAVVTMSGTAYGDLVPLNPTQTAYTFGSVALPMIIYAYLFSVIFNAISERRSKSIQATKYKKMSKYYFKDLGIDTALSVKLMNYLNYVYEKKITVDNDFLENLAPSLKKQYVRTIVDSNYNYSVFYPLCRPEFDLQSIKNIVYDVIEEQSLPSGFIISHKTQKIKLYFLNYGSAMEIVQIKQKKYRKRINNRSFLMLHPFFTGMYSMPKTNSFEIKEFSICQVIKYSEFMEYVYKPQNQTLRQSYCMYRDQILFQQSYSKIKCDCFFCDSAEHFIFQCPKLRLQTNIQQLSNKTLKRNELNHNKFHVRKRFHDKTQHFVSGHKQKMTMKKKLQEKLSEIMVQKLLDENISRSVQTDIDEKNWKMKLKAQPAFQRLFNYKVYYPTYSYI